MREIAHVINPVNLGKTSDLFVAQPITFETMRIAQRFAAAHAAITLFSVQFPEERALVPAGFQPTPNLEQSILDIGHFQERRNLPLLKDILDCLYQATDAEYLIYTNVDIALQPHFYLAVNHFIEQGYDAFAINRRTISDRYSRIDQIPLMYAEVGQPHRGWDCFVFRRDAYQRYKLGTICIGATRVGLALLANLEAYANNFREFKDVHLTFHIGDERNWLNKAYADYDEHNTRQLLDILETLENEVGAFRRSTIPGSFLFKMRKFGLIYDYWARNVYLPMRISRFLNIIIRRP